MSRRGNTSSRKKASHSGPLSRSPHSTIDSMTLDQFVDTKRVEEKTTTAVTTTTTTTSTTVKTAIVEAKRNIVESKKDDKVKPPPRAVKTIRELIYWEYAKLIAKAAGFDKNYGFIMSRFMKLKNKRIRWSEIEKMTKRRCWKKENAYTVVQRKICQLIISSH